MKTMEELKRRNEELELLNDELVGRIALIYDEVMNPDNVNAIRLFLLSSATRIECLREKPISEIVEETLIKWG